eukprot:4936341-Pleurochrysis_carterae.AAC.1
MHSRPTRVRARRLSTRACCVRASSRCARISATRRSRLPDGGQRSTSSARDTCRPSAVPGSPTTTCLEGRRVGLPRPPRVLTASNACAYARDFNGAGVPLPLLCALGRWRRHPPARGVAAARRAAKRPSNCRCTLGCIGAPAAPRPPRAAPRAETAPAWPRPGRPAARRGWRRMRLVEARLRIRNRRRHQCRPARICEGRMPPPKPGRLSTTTPALAGPFVRAKPHEALQPRICPLDRTEAVRRFRITTLAAARSPARAPSSLPTVSMMATGPPPVPMPACGRGRVTTHSASGADAFTPSWPPKLELVVTRGFS